MLDGKILGWRDRYLGIVPESIGGHTTLHPLDIIIYIFNARYSYGFIIVQLSITALGLLTLNIHTICSLYLS
jgi:hypothetical protein